MEARFLGNEEVDRLALDWREGGKEEERRRRGGGRERFGRTERDKALIDPTRGLLNK